MKMRVNKAKDVNWTVFMRAKFNVVNNDMGNMCVVILGEGFHVPQLFHPVWKFAHSYTSIRTRTVR